MTAGIRRHVSFAIKEDTEFPAFRGKERTPVPCGRNGDGRNGQDRGVKKRRRSERKGSQGKERDPARKARTRTVKIVERPRALNPKPTAKGHHHFVGEELRNWSEEIMFVSHFVSYL